MGIDVMLLQRWEGRRLLADISRVSPVSNTSWTPVLKTNLFEVSIDISPFYTQDKCGSEHLNTMPEIR